MLSDHDTLHSGCQSCISYRQTRRGPDEPSGKVSSWKSMVSREYLGHGRHGIVGCVAIVIRWYPCELGLCISCRLSVVMLSQWCSGWYCGSCGRDLYKIGWGVLGVVSSKFQRYAVLCSLYYICCILGSVQRLSITSAAISLCCLLLFPALPGVSVYLSEKDGFGVFWWQRYFIVNSLDSVY